MKGLRGCFVVLFLFLAACGVKNQAEDNGYEVQSAPSDAESVHSQSKEDEDRDDAKIEDEHMEIPSVNEEAVDSTNFDLDKYMEIADFVWDNIPELKNYAEYVEEKSEGHAAFVVAPNYELKELYVENEFRGNYYYVYTGEVWEDHRVNWDWFLVSEDFDEILWWDIVEIEYLTLDEWRQSSSYRELEW